MINKIFNEDCLIGMKRIPDKSIDCICTDPPYKLIAGGVTGKLSKKITGICLDYTNVNTKNGNGNFKINTLKFSEWIPECFRILKNDTHCYIMVNDRNLQEMLNETQKVGFKLLNVLVWNKNNAMPNHWYMKNAEFIIMLRKGKANYINNQGSKQCMQFDNVKNKIHPTEKPIALFEKLIQNSTLENQIVFDPFIGGGTTALAAKNINRKYIGFELDKTYFDIAQKRIQDAQTLFSCM